MTTAPIRPPRKPRPKRTLVERLVCENELAIRLPLGGGQMAARGAVTWVLALIVALLATVLLVR